MNKHTVLYLHGLDSKPVVTKLTSISDLGHAVIAPMMHYREELSLFQRVLDIAWYYKIDCIVGSSMGGYMGFWLAHKLQVPALLFNPALYYRLTDKRLVPTGIKLLPDLPIHIYLGMKDDIVLPHSSYDWVNEHYPEHTIEWLENYKGAHRIDEYTFERVVKKVMV